MNELTFALRPRSQLVAFSNQIDAIQNIIESVNHRNRFIQEQAIR
jgi:hypothetical protein